MQDKIQNGRLISKKSIEFLKLSYNMIKLLNETHTDTLKFFAQYKIKCKKNCKNINNLNKCLKTNINCESSFTKFNKTKYDKFKKYYETYNEMVEKYVITKQLYIPDVPNERPNNSNKNKFTNRLKFKQNNIINILHLCYTNPIELTFDNLLNAQNNKEFQYFYAFQDLVQIINDKECDDPNLIFNILFVNENVATPPIKYGYIFNDKSFEDNISSKDKTWILPYGEYNISSNYTNRILLNDIEINFRNPYNFKQYFFPWFLILNIFNKSNKNKDILEHISNSNNKKYNNIKILTKTKYLRTLFGIKKVSLNDPRHVTPINAVPIGATIGYEIKVKLENNILKFYYPKSTETIQAFNHINE